MGTIDAVAGHLSPSHVALPAGTLTLWQRFQASLARGFSHLLDLDRKVPHY